MWFQRVFGDFLRGQKVTRRRNLWAQINTFKIKVSDQAKSIGIHSDIHGKPISLIH